MVFPVEWQTWVSYSLLFNTQFVVRFPSWAVMTHAGASTKRHAYWAMANCGGSGDRLRELLLNIVQHYQVLISYSHFIPVLYYIIFYTHFIEQPHWLPWIIIMQTPWIQPRQGSHYWCKGSRSVLGEDQRSLAVYWYAESYARVSNDSVI